MGDVFHGASESALNKLVNEVEEILGEDFKNPYENPDFVQEIRNWIPIAMALNDLVIEDGTDLEIGAKDNMSLEERYTKYTMRDIRFSQLYHGCTPLYYPAISGRLRKGENMELITIVSKDDPKEIAVLLRAHWDKQLKPLLAFKNLQ